MNMTRNAAFLIIIFIVAGFGYTACTGSMGLQILLLAFGPSLLGTQLFINASRTKAGLLRALKTTLSCETNSSRLTVIFLVLWAAVVWTDMNSCHIGREDDDFEAKRVELEMRMRQKPLQHATPGKRLNAG